jgi:hypothetical protein
MTDHVLRELWSIKDGLADECERDLRRLFDKLKATQKSSCHPVVDRTRQRPKAGSFH